MVENFYGNKANKIVHDLSNEKPKCEIKSIKIYNKRYFMPDTFEQAVLENYTNCPYCIHDDDRLITGVVDEKLLEQSNKARERIVNDTEIEKNQEEEKVRIKASKAARRNGGSKKESKIKKSKAKTKEKRSSKKIATVRKRRQ